MLKKKVGEARISDTEETKAVEERSLAHTEQKRKKCWEYGRLAWQTDLVQPGVVALQQILHKPVGCTFVCLLLDHFADVFSRLARVRILEIKASHSTHSKATNLQQLNRHGQRDHLQLASIR